MLKSILKRSLLYFLSANTVNAVLFDLLRFKTRLKQSKKKSFSTKKLHLGCGKRIVDGWLNVDVSGSDWNIDLANGILPFEDNTFQVVTSQHFIEHLYIDSELFPLFKELSRVCEVNAEIWLSCPSMEKVCKSYIENNGTLIHEGRMRRFKTFELSKHKNVPEQQIINDVFHQGGEHKNLFDFKLLKWLLESTGFDNVQEVEEKDFLGRFPEFSLRDDDEVSIYVCAKVTK